MGKDAISNAKKEKSPSSNAGGSPIIFILAIFAIIVIGLYLFKDKIFKKSNAKTELPKSENIDNSKDEPVKPETLTEPQATEINDKFAEMSK